MAELVIGARRSRGRRVLKSLLWACLFGSAIAGAAAFGFHRLVTYDEPGVAIPQHRPSAALADDSGRGGRLVYGPSALEYAGGVAIHRLEGEPGAIGAARARLATDFAPTARALLASLEAPISDGGIAAGALRRPRASWRFRNVAEGLSDPTARALAGAARGAARAPGDAPSYTDLVRAQTALDLGGPAGGSDPSFDRVARALSFSALARGAARDRLMIGRSFAIPGAGAEGPLVRPQVAFVHPDGAIPYASVGWPMAGGAVTGINAEGVAVMLHPARSENVEPGGIGRPTPVIVREVLEAARDLDGALAILREAEPLGAASFLVAARGGGRAVVELSPGEASVRRDPEERAVTGILASSAFEDDRESARAAETWPDALRASRAEELLSRRRIGRAADVAGVLRDRAGEGGALLPAGHRGAIEDDSAIHTAIVDVDGMILYVGEGPGASGRFLAFDLRRELGSARARLGPIEPIPRSEDDGALARAGALTAARAWLRRARLAHRGGRADEAYAHVERALARAPDLPEALALAGDYARERDRDDDAARLYRRYLDAGADAPAKGESVRAHIGESP